MRLPIRPLRVRKDLPDARSRHPFEMWAPCDQGESHRLLKQAGAAHSGPAGMVLLRPFDICLHYAALTNQGQDLGVSLWPITKMNDSCSRGGCAPCLSGCSRVCTSGAGRCRQRSRISAAAPLHAGDHSGPVALTSCTTSCRLAPPAASLRGLCSCAGCHLCARLPGGPDSWHQYSQRLKGAQHLPADVAEAWPSEHACL